MTDNERWLHIETVLRKMKANTERFNDLIDKIGLMPESVLCESLYQIQDDCIKTLSYLVDDNFDNISWYVFECEYGDKDMEAGKEGDIRAIKTIDDLRWLVELNNS
jgi:hypothetical protein